MTTEIVNAILELMSGLALFIFGMKFMSENLQQAAGQKLRTVLDKCTRNRFLGILSGALFTAFIQSSGATTVMEVGFVNTGILTLEKSVGLTLGADVGTSITSQLVSLKLTSIAPYIIFAGAGMLMFVKKPLIKRVASIIFGFGALFTGIKFMTEALSIIGTNPSVQEAAKSMNTPIIAVLVGLLATTIVQSSSVTVSVLVLLASIPALGLTDTACNYFMIGAYVGACTPAILASLHTNKEAKRATFVYFMFNVSGLVILGLTFIFFREQINAFVHSISGPDMKRFVANSDTLYKVSICIIGCILANPLMALSKKLIKTNDKEKSEEMHLEYIDDSGTQVPTTVIVEVVAEINRMGGMVRDNLVASMEALIQNDRKRSEDIYKREEYIDYLSHRITEYLVQANRYDLPLADRNRMGGLFHVVIDIERIGDHAVNFIDDAWKEKQNHVKFSDEGKQQIIDMYDKVLEIYDKAIDIFLTGDESRFDEVNALEDVIDQMEIDCQESHVERMADGRCSIEAGLIFTDLVIGLERVADHSMNIAYSILPEKQD